MSIREVPAAWAKAEPQTSVAAPCGLVDGMDFPLNPPDGAGVRGGTDFGIFRRRYDKFHAGEDWWFSNGRSSLGKPVYSIAHGQVTLADGLAWGRDQGVVIVRHTWEDGLSLLSFYGHLDPDSISLVPGACVTRGQQLAKIGDPRGSPHLHFEIRKHAPYRTLTGYWPEDPTIAGWLSPSEVIWKDRVARSPGVLSHLDGDGWETIVPVQDEKGTVLAISANAITILEPGSDAQPIGFPLGFRPATAFVDHQRRVLIAASRSGHVVGWQLAAPPPVEDESTADSADADDWSLDLDEFGSPRFLPLPGNDYLMALSDLLTAMTPDGEIKWQQRLGAQLHDWVVVGDTVILTTAGASGDVWQVTEAGASAWQVDTGGSLAAGGEAVWIHNPEGILQLDIETRDIIAEHSLPRSRVDFGDMLALADGSLLLAHFGFEDQQLLLLDPSGDVRWRRSFKRAVTGRITLLQVGAELYLMAVSLSGPNATIELFALDITRIELTHIFTAGTRNPSGTGAWAVPILGDRILLNNFNTNLFIIDPAVARLAQGQDAQNVAPESGNPNRLPGSDVGPSTQ